MSCSICPMLQLIMIGGRVDRKVGAAMGAQAMREMERLRPDMAFIGACAIDAARRVTAFDAEDAEFKRAPDAAGANSAGGLVNEKIGTVAPYSVPAASALSTTLSDRELISIPHKKASLDIWRNQCWSAPERNLYVCHCHDTINMLPPAGAGLSRRCFSSTVSSSAPGRRRSR